MNPLRTIRDRFTRRWTDAEDALWLASPAGCCECGTGGPYYTGDAPRVTRYLYVKATRTGNTPDWTSCSAHPVRSLTPVVDYGQDVTVTFQQTDADTLTALTASHALVNETTRAFFTDVTAKCRAAADKIKGIR